MSYLDKNGLQHYHDNAVKPLKNILDIITIHKPVINLFNGNLTNGNVRPNTGAIVTSGDNSTNYSYTDSIPVEQGKYLVASCGGSLAQMRYVAFFNSNDVVIPNAIYTDHSSHLVPANAVKAIVTFHKAWRGKSIQLELSDTIDTFTSYEKYHGDTYRINPEAELSWFYGKRVAWLGTSITYGYSWCSKVNTFFNFNAINCGVEGTKMCAKDDASMCTTTRLLGQYGASTDEHTGAVNTNIVAIPSDVDVIFVEAGTNDWANNAPMGNKLLTFSGTEFNFDSTTFYGACHQFCKNVVDLFPNAVVVAVGSPYCRIANRDAFGNKFGLINNLGLTSVDYGDALAETVGRWGYYGFNMGAEANVNIRNLATLTYKSNKPEGDGIHPNTDAYATILANVVINHLLNIKNPL